MARNAVAFEVPNGSHPDARKPGAFYFMYRWTEVDEITEGRKQTDERLGIIHACPCGCGGKGAIWFRGKSMNGSGSNPDAEWDVTGEWPKATLSPSIGFGRLKDGGGYHWHGYLRDGVFEEC